MARVTEDTVDSWNTKYLPFIKGLDLSQDSLLDSQSFTVAENVDWDHQGAIRGRPSRAAADNFVVARAWPLSQPPTYAPPAAFSATGYTPRGLCNAKTPLGERPLLACDGRLFAHGDSQWVDQGPFGAMDVQRVPFFVAGSPDASRVRQAAAPGFVPPNIVDSGSGGPQQFLVDLPFTLLDSAGGQVQTVNTGLSGVPGYRGNATRMGTVTALVQPTLDGHLTLLRRSDGSSTITASTVATDADTNPADALLPVVCASSSHLYVAYHTSGDQYKVVQLSSSDYSVVASFTGTQTGLQGLWIDVTPDESTLVVALTSSDNVAPTFHGITIKVLDSSLHDKNLDSTQAVGGQNAPGEVVVALVAPPGWATTAVWAYRHNYTDNTGASKPADIVVGTASITSGNSATIYKRFYGDGTAGSTLYVNWSICHQPILFNGRVYLTLVAGCASDTSNTNWSGTWITWDVTDIVNSADPHPVARGPWEGTTPYPAAAVAVPLADGTGWQFTTTDWAANEDLGIGGITLGLTPCGVMNYVRVLNPRTVDANDVTLFSGSVPHVWDGSRCREFGFPFLGGTPNLTAAAVSGGTLAVGSYTVTAVWRWTDARGNIVRSASAPGYTVATLSGYQQIQVSAICPVTGRSDAAFIDFYCTEVNPTGSAVHYYVGSVGVNASGSMATLWITSVNTANDTVYSDGNVLNNSHVRGAGGIAVLGRRVWFAHDSHLYASKLPQFSTAVEFQEDGALDVVLPSSAGRILSLEEHTDRLFVFCQRGVFVLADGGPNNIGQGLDFGAPVRISDLGIDNSRATCRTDAGVVFVVPLDPTSTRLGGPRLTDGLTVQSLADGIRGYNLADGLIPEVAYCPERNAVFMAYETADNTGVVMLDLQEHRAATWTCAASVFGAQRSISCSGGHLWTLCNEPAPLNGPPGTDAGSQDYTMTLTTGHIPVFGSTVGWGRVRSVTPLGTDNTGGYTLTLTALLDQETSVTSGAQTIPGLNSFGSWPEGRQAPEWRLPTQKCSTIQVTLAASPATAEWAAVALKVRPISVTAPSYQRF